MDPTVQGFYTKNADQAYIDQYEKDHGPRLDAMVERFKVKDLNARVLDVGGGLGFLGKRLGTMLDYTVVDGAEVPESKRLCPGVYYKTDLDHVVFGSEDGDNGLNRRMPFDIAFCLETLEHCGNPHNVLVEIKKLVTIGGHVIISIPHENVTHNTPYPGLLWPVQNFAQFLGQMALPIRDYWLWEKGWNAYHFRCENRPWAEKQLLYPKQETKFLDVTPLACTNL